jgi:uncharacterized protein (TIGR04255 family)
MEPKEALAQELQISPTQVSSQNTPFTQWHFHGRERDKTLVVLPASVFAVYNKYETFEKVQDEFIGVLKNFFSVFRDAQPSRLGLRYINKIHFPQGDPLDWSAYITKQMLVLLDFPKDKKSLTRLFHNLEMDYGEFNVRYQFGLHNPDYPAKIKQRVFLLDLDAYHQGPIELGEIEASLKQYHDSIQELFEMSITPELRQKMNDGS